MSMQITQYAYRQLVTEDILWLLANTKDSLERQHIIAVLESSIQQLYNNPEKEKQK